MSYLLDQRQKQAESAQVEAANRKLFAEKMQALQDSHGDLGELVNKTPGASIEVGNQNDYPESD